MPPPAGRRVVFVAKPAQDMDDAYRRIVRELEGSGYAVVPGADESVPTEDKDAAIAFVDGALASAEIAIHLVGERQGPSPDECRPLVPFQLERSAAWITAQQQRARLVWIPRVVQQKSGDEVTQLEREPLDVLKRYGDDAEGAKIDGNDLGTFIDFLKDYLAKSATSSGPGPAVPGGSGVYIYYRQDDRAYAEELADALYEREIDAVLAASDGSPEEIAAFHRAQLQSCDAVVLSWAKSSEVWMLSQAAELEDWNALGRQHAFTCRALVVGPPGAEIKQSRVKRPPRRQLDLVVDLSGDDAKPDAQRLQPVIEAARGRPAS